MLLLWVCLVREVLEKSMSKAVLIALTGDPWKGFLPMESGLLLPSAAGAASLLRSWQFMLEFKSRGCTQSPFHDGHQNPVPVLLLVN